MVERSSDAQAQAGAAARAQLAGVWMGVAAIVVFTIGLLPLCGWVPPPSPRLTGPAVQAELLHHTDAKRLGLLLIMISGVLLCGFYCTISVQIRRLEGASPFLTYLQLAMAIIGTVMFIVPAFMMEVALFRPERSPDDLLLMWDAMWLPFIASWPPFVIQWVAIGLAAFKDTDSKVFPRWFGYLSFWCAFEFTCTSGVFFVKSGPFGWNGLISFWLTVVVTFAWFVSAFVLVHRAIRRERNDALVRI
jgi:hypothetical protein